MEKIQKHGVRNSLTTACMPTASTGIILGNTETFQVQTSNIYKRQTLSGEFLLYRNCHQLFNVFRSNVNRTPSF